MNETLPTTKPELRKLFRARLTALSPEERHIRSDKACALLRLQAIWQNSQTILFYAAMPQELDLWPLIHEALAGGKSVFLPAYDAPSGCYRACRITDVKADLIPGKLGILEPGKHCKPNPSNQLDLILVPGLGFDPSGGRLGRGRGFYDRLLAQMVGTQCGVAFDEQVIPAIPTEPHDIRLSCILTPTRWLAVDRRSFE